DETTEKPAVFNSTTGTILVTHSIDANGHAINCTSCGGVAYVNVFGRSNYHTYYSPALVFYDNLGGGSETYVAEASSHEFGHNLGLSHDGTNSGSSYYGGHGSGLVSWAPIMGNSYYNNVTEWSRGEYPDANQTEDDLAIIEGKLGYYPDDHGDTQATATSLAVDPDGSVVASNPELDPYNTLPENKGVIGSADDVDVFLFVAGAGTVDLAINPAWDAFYRSTNRRGGNLDVEAELLNQAGVTVAYSEPSDDTRAVISTTVSAGTYYLLISGAGNSVTPYSDYGSLGEYFINGSIPNAGADEIAPTPNPMSWSSVPVAISGSAIGMTATNVVDDRSAVEYTFLCVAGDAQCSNANSGWQSSSSYTATGLTSGTTYSFQTLARDQAGNETGKSPIASATTTAPLPPPLAPSGFSAEGISETAISLGWTDNAGNENSYRIERVPGPAGQSSFTTIANLASNAIAFMDTGLTADTTYTYRVAAVNSSADSEYATASGTTMAPPSYTDFGANGQTVVAGTVSGSYTNTFNDDGLSQAITETKSGGRPSIRYSYLEHRWNFNIGAGSRVTVYANAWSSWSSDGDAFRFEYSLDNGSTFSTLFTVSATTNSNLQMADIPNAPAGSVIVRVVDTNHTRGNNAQDTIYVDQLYIQVGNPSNDPPNGQPTGLDAQAVDYNHIDLNWTNGSNNESGITVERSLNGTTGWTVVADLPAGSSSFSNIGLTAQTTYYYRVSAHTLPEMVSDYAYASATTTSAPQQPQLSLEANGYKLKGLQHIGLSWNGSNNVVVYRNDIIIGTVSNGNSYDDSVGKTGGTFNHKVCDTVTAACSNATTTIF
ncbi:MAG: fibronectin type III domain-containing protein, partial [Lysobacterales bacterium]